MSTVNRMVVSNLLHRPVRTMLSVIAIAVEVLLIISVVGLVTGQLDEATRRLRGVGADILVQPSGVSLFSMSSAGLSAKLGPRLAEFPHVSVVAPVLVQSSGGLTVVYGIEKDSFRQLSGGFEFLAGRDLEGGKELLIDDIHAASNHWRAGQKVPFWNHEFTVVGIVAHGKGARLFMPLAIAQDLQSAEGKVSVFFIRLDDPQWTSPVLDKIKELLPGYNIRSMEEYTSLLTVSSFPGLQPFVRIMIGIAVTIGFLVIFLAMYTTVLERTREIGILKSLGASKSYVTNLILREVLAMTVAGILAGMAGSFALRKIVITSAPTVTVLIQLPWLWRAALIAVASSVIGALYPAIRAARQDPIVALAYE